MSDDIERWGPNSGADLQMERWVADQEDGDGEEPPLWAEENDDGPEPVWADQG